MKRREFIALLGSAATWPLTAQAQQGERVRRIGVLANQAIDEPETQVRVTAFVRRLQELGWTEGRNLQIEHRWAAGDTDNARRYAAELVAAPDVILASGASIVSALQRATRTPQHISGLPAEVRNAIAPFARACGGRLVAQHSFASYFQRGTAKLIGLHFEHLRCANRAAICSAAGCLHQVYISTGGPVPALEQLPRAGARSDAGQACGAIGATKIGELERPQAVEIRPLMFCARGPYS